MSKPQLILIGGESATGKSASLKDIKDQERWIYLNTESGKELPFQNSFTSKVVVDPYQLEKVFIHAQGNPDFDGIIIDSVTFLMDMFESLYVVGAKDGRAAWGNYSQYFKTLMQQWVAKTDKHVIILGHTRSEQDAMAVNQVSVPIKGALKNNGIEAYFSTVISTKKVTLTDLKKYSSPLLNITPDDELLGFKYVFQTRLTKETVGERIRGPMGLFSVSETFMDNDVSLLLDHMIKYYA